VEHFERYPSHTYELVTSHMWISHVAHKNESCHTYNWVVWHTYTWVIWHTWMSHVTHRHKLCHNLSIMWNGTPAAKTRNWSRESTYFCDMRSIWPSVHSWMSHVENKMSHVSHMSHIWSHIKESCVTYLREESWRKKISHVSYMIA